MIKQSDIREVVEKIVNRSNRELLEKSESDLANEWYWHWDETKNVSWNVYNFCTMLELYARRTRKWEEHHNGSAGVVGRVRDRYAIPKIKEFLEQLVEHI